MLLAGKCNRHAKKCDRWLKKGAISHFGGERHVSTIASDKTRREFVPRPLLY
jgi:hypothetical protein